jgi:hypothetical protein
MRVKNPAVIIEGKRREPMKKLLTSLNLIINQERKKGLTKENF